MTLLLSLFADEKIEDRNFQVVKPVFKFPGGSEGKESACNARESQVRSVGSGGYPGEGNGNSLQYSCLDNSMEGIPCDRVGHN